MSSEKTEGKLDTISEACDTSHGDIGNQSRYYVLLKCFSSSTKYPIYIIQTYKLHFIWNLSISARQNTAEKGYENGLDISDDEASKN